MTRMGMIVDLLKDNGPMFRNYSDARKDLQKINYQYTYSWDAFVIGHDKNN